MLDPPSFFRIRYELFLQNTSAQDKFYTAHESIKTKTASTLISKGEWSEDSARNMFKGLLDDIKTLYKEKVLDFNISCLLDSFFEAYVIKRVQIAMICNYLWSPYQVEEKFYYPVLIGVIVDVVNDIAYKLPHLNNFLQLHHNKVTYDEVLSLINHVFASPHMEFYRCNFFNYQNFIEYVKTVSRDIFKEEVIKKYFGNCVHRMSLVMLSKNRNNKLIKLKTLS